MSDQQSYIRNLIEKKFSAFCAKEGVRCCFEISSEMVLTTNGIDALLYLCSKLPNRKLQLAFLDFFIQTVTLLDEKAIDQIIKYLLRVFKDTTENSCVQGKQCDSVLSNCAKLMVYCLTHSHAPSNSYVFFMEAIDQIKSIICGSTNVECLISYAILFINIVKLERKDYLAEILAVLNQSENSPSSDITGNLSFLFQLFHSSNSRAQLAILLALVGILSTTDWFCNYENYGNISLYVLSMAGFSVDPNDHLLRKFNQNDSVTNLLQSKIVYNWSKKNLLNHYEDDVERNIEQFNVFTSPLLTYCIDMRSSYIDAIRYSALDTIENIIFFHLKYCDECRQSRISDNKSKISCGYLNEILNQLVSDSCYSRGTIAMLTRFIHCMSKTRVYRTINLLHSLDSVFQPFVNDTNLEICGRIVSGSMKIADDPNLASEISELYTLITHNLYTENDPLIYVWLSGLVDTFIRNSNETFHSTVIQNILPSLVKTNPKLLELLVKCCNSDSVKMNTDLPTFLLTCYHLLSFNGMKTDCCEYLSLNFLTSCLRSYDNQLRLTALNVLVSLITKSKQKMILSNEKLEMFLNYLRHDLWPNSKRIHGQIVSAIKDILLHTLPIMKRETNDTNLNNLKSFHVEMVHILMTCIYPGSPASRLSLGLAGLYTVVECFHSVFYTDDYSEFMAQIMSCLIKATQNVYTIPSFTDENFKPIDHSTSQLFFLFLTGLCSRYDVDRDYTVKILLRLDVLKQLNPNYINKLWTDTLEIYAQSSKPDVNPIAGDILRFLIYGNENVDKSNQLSSSSSSVDKKLIQAIDCLVNQLQEQITICEKLPVIGLMSVATNKPFYAILSTIRSIIGVTSSSPLNKKNKKPTDAQIWSNTSIKAESLFKQINGVNVIERIISLGLRISEIVLPVVGHESPEGVLLTSQQDVIIDDIKTADEEASQLYKFYEKTRNHPEYLILCCWRSVRELSLLMGISLVSYGLNKFDSNQIKPKEIFSIARFFCTQLLCCRHRGAFELCATGFTNFCTALVNHPVYFTIPIHWLNAVTGQTLSLNEKSTNDCSTVIENIDFSLESCMGKHNTMECITRRGAGYPLFVQAILTADLTRNTNVSTTTLTNTVCWLLKSVKTSFCNNNLQQSNNLSTCVLHLNIIRDIFQSKNLNYHTDKYLQKALIIALDGVGCGDLSIRNASILFYSTLVQRIFGVNRSNAVKSRKNCLATSTFFKRYPKFEHYFVETLTSYSKNTNIPHPSSFKLYSILHLMTHLLPSLQVTEIDKMLYKLLIRCGFSDDIRIRKIASLALTSIIHPSVIMTTLNHLFDLMELFHESMPVKRWCNIRLNILHGLLLQIYALMYSNMDIHDSTPSVYTVSTISYLSKSNYLTIINRLKSSFSWLNDSAYVTCTIIKQLYMKILNCHYNQPIQIETNVIGLEYDYLITHIYVLIDCTLNNSENSTLSPTTFYLNLIKWTKSMNSINLLTVALRRICSYLHSTLAHSTLNDNNFDIEDINEIIDASEHLNSSIFNKLKTLFPFQTLFQNFIRLYFRLDENIPHNNNHKDDEAYRYAFALLTIQLQHQSDHDSTDISRKLILAAFRWSCKQMKLLFKKMKCLNSPPIYLAAFIRFHTKLITVIYNKESDDDVSLILSKFCNLGNLCFNILQHSHTTTTTHVCLEVKYAVLHSFFVSRIFVNCLSFSSEEDIKKVFLQSFDILIENINNLESSKLQKLTCKTVQNILMFSDPKFQCVTQSPYILLDGLIKFVLLHGNFSLYEHLLLFLRKKVRHFKELNSQLDNVISENAFSQTTLKFENDQVELIKIISDNITKWIQPYLDALYVSLHEDDRMDYIQNDLDKSLCRVMDFNDMVPFLIFKSDYASLLYLNRYTDNRMILLL